MPLTFAPLLPPLSPQLWRIASAEGVGLDAIGDRCATDPDAALSGELLQRVIA
jgi:hypothetical protein